MALQLRYSLGILNNLLPFKAILDLFCPLRKHADGQIGELCVHLMTVTQKKHSSMNTEALNTSICLENAALKAYKPSYDFRQVRRSETLNNTIENRHD